jgi:hypothetical protein
MRHLFSAVIVTASLTLASAAFAQSTPAPAPGGPAPASPATAGPAAAAPVAVGKRMACRSASQALSGQDKKDQIQLCMVQARLDCLKQAIDQKIVGPQRRDFVKSCTE